MADYLNDFVTSLLSEGTQKSLSEQNPYLQIKQAPDLLSQGVLQAVSKSPGKYSMGEALGLALGGGLASGVLGNLGQSYQNDLTNKYLDAVTGTGGFEQLPSGLFGQAQLQQKLFQLNNASKEAEALRELKKAKELAGFNSRQEIAKTILSKAIDNPRAAKKAFAEYPDLFASFLGVETQAPTAQKIETAGEKLADATGTEAPKVAEGRGVEGTILDQMLAEANRITESSDVSPEQALITARQAFTEKREQLGRQYTRIEEANKQAGELRSLSDQARMAIQDAGYTGPGGEALQSLAGLGSLVSGGQQQKYSAGQQLQNMQSAVIAIQGRAFKGPMSDRDVAIMLRAAPSLTNTEEANSAIIEKWDYAATLQDQYADFMREKQDAGVPVSKAEAEWQKIKKDNPYVIKTKSGKLEINPAWKDGTILEKKPASESEDDIKALVTSLEGGGGSGGSEPGSEAIAETKAPYDIANVPWSERLWKTVQGPSGAYELATGRKPLEDAGYLGQKLFQGVKETPQLLTDLFSKKTYQEAFKSPEQTARTLGKGAAMTAGAAKGGALGAAAGTAVFPGVGTAIGGGLGAAAGAGAGYLGFDAAEEAASELAGVGTEKSVIPTREDVGTAAEVAGQGLGAGAVAKGLSVPVKVAGSALKGAAGKVASLVPGAEKNLLGVTPGNIEKAFKTGQVKYFDEQGRQVPATNAAELKTGVQQSIERVKNDGFFEKVGNNPDTLKLALAGKLEQGAAVINKLHLRTADALEQIYQKLTPIQKKQFDRGFNPNFGEVKAAIREIAQTEPQLAKSMTTRANAIISKWQKSKRSYLKLQDFKEAFGENAKWDVPLSTQDAAWNQVKKSFYGVFSKSQSDAFKFAMGQVNPELVGALDQANGLYHAYKNLEPIVNKTASKGTPSLKFSPLGLGLITSGAEKFPKTMVSGTQALASGLGKGAAASESLAAGLDKLFGASELSTGLQGIGPVLSDESKKKSMTNETSGDVDTLFNAQDPLTRAQIMQESAKKPNAVSKAGAIGLMQVMPATAKEIAAELGIKNYDLKDPATSLKFGTHYRNKLLKQFGDVKLALAAYNWGPTRLQNLIDRLGVSDWDTLKKYMPQETQDYVPGILNRIEQV